MSSTTYTKEQYALDKICVRETMASMYWYADVNDLDKLTEKTFAPRMTLDYSVLLGWPVQERTAEDQVAYFKALLPTFEQYAHVVTASVDELPAPDGKNATPDACRVFATVYVYLRKDRGGKKVEANSYTRGTFDLVRGDDAGNPWRIKGAKFIPVWSADPDKIWEQ